MIVQISVLVGISIALIMIGIIIGSALVAILGVLLMVATFVFVGFRDSLD